MLKRRTTAAVAVRGNRGRLPPLGPQVSPRQTTIDTLPDAALGAIFAFAVAAAAAAGSPHAAGRTIVRLCCVCRRWNAVVSASAAIWRPFVRARYPKSAPPTLAASSSSSQRQQTEWRKVAFTAAMGERRKRLGPEVRRALQARAACANDFQRALRAVAIDWSRAVRINHASLLYSIDTSNDVRVHGGLICVCAQQATASPVRLFDLRSVCVVARSRLLESGNEYVLLDCTVPAQQPTPTVGDAQMKLVELPDDNRGALAVLGVFATGEIAFVFASFPALNAVAAIWRKEAPPAQPARHVPVVDDVDSTRGLRDYTVDITLRNFDDVLWQQTFHKIDGKIVNDDAAVGRCVLLSVIEHDGKAAREVLSSPPNLAWKTAAFRATLPNVLLIDVAVTDANGEIAWAFSRLAHFQADDQPGGSGFIDEQPQLAWSHVHPGVGAAGMALVEFEPGCGEFSIADVWIALDASFVSRWFGREQL